MTQKYGHSMEGEIPAGVSPLGDAMREAIGAAPGDTVTFRTPQFARPASWPAPGGQAAADLDATVAVRVARS